MEEKDLTYKVKCRSCSKITEIYFSSTEKTNKLTFITDMLEHSTFPITKQCECDNGSIMFHDLISYKIIF